MSNCSLCFSEGTNKTTCPLNPTASNQDCERHYNAKIIQRILNHRFKEGEIDCRDDSYNPPESRVKKTRCEDKKITGNEYFISSSPGNRYLKTTYLCGKGSFKKVFLARDLKHNMDSEQSFFVLSEIEVTKEAAKAIGISFREMGARLINEIKVMEMNDHPNIIEFKGSWHDPEKKTVSIITEHLVGGDLDYVFSKRIANNILFTKIELSKMFKDILQGLWYIHSRGLIHRDLKPANIGIANDGKLKLLDFGLTSKELGHVLAPTPPVPNQPVMLRQLSVNSKEDKPIYVNAFLGTPEYMAPEILNENYNEKIDIYAFGIMALEFIIFRKQFPKNAGNFTYLLAGINKLYKDSASKSGAASKGRTGVGGKEQILKAEYRRFLQLSEGYDLNEDDIIRILSIYEPYGNRAESFRRLVEDCIVHPEERLGAGELLKKYWKNGRIFDFR